MMDNTNEMESILSRYRPAGPNAALRDRIVRQGHRRSGWLFLEAMAAMLLIGMNLAQISASATQFISSSHADEARIQEIATALRRLDLPVSPDETQAMAVRLAAADRLVPLPSLHGTGMITSSQGVIP
jgi:hypothetical protein